jgi:O-antigen/teichoic acid export membrane protein
MNDSAVRIVCYGANLLLGLGSLLYVAKLAGPVEVGIYASALVLIQPLSDFCSTGITREGYAGDSADHPSLVLANLLISTILSCGIFFWACLAEASTPTKILSWMIVLAAIDGYQTGTLLRNLRFKRTAISGTLAMLAGLMTTIIAIKHQSPSVAMAEGLLATCITKILFNWVRVTPRWEVSHRKLRFSILRSCWIYSGSKMLGNIARNVAVWSTLTHGDASGVGLLTRAQRISEVPSNIFGAGKGGMLAPLMAEIQRSGGDVRQYYQANLRSAAIISLPMFSVVAVGTIWIEKHYLGKEWHGLASLGILMALSSSFRNLSKVTEDYSRQIGMEYFSLMLNLVSIPLTYITYSYVISVTGSMLTMAACFVAFAALFWMIRFIYVMQKDGPKDNNWCGAFVRQLGTVPIMCIFAQFVLAAALLGCLLEQ